MNNDEEMRNARIEGAARWALEVLKMLPRQSMMTKMARRKLEAALTSIDVSPLADKIAANQMLDEQVESDTIETAVSFAELINGNGEVSGL